MNSLKELHALAEKIRQERNLPPVPVLPCVVINQPMDISTEQEFKGPCSYAFEHLLACGRGKAIGRLVSWSVQFADFQVVNKNS